MKEKSQSSKRALTELVFNQEKERWMLKHFQYDLTNTKPHPMFNIFFLGSILTSFYLIFGHKR